MLAWAKQIWLRLGSLRSRERLDRDLMTKWRFIWPCGSRRIEAWG
jgi:hypothetical protein